MSAEIRQWAGVGGVALWGAGAKGATVSHLLDPQRELIRCIVDLNPQKQGRYIAGTGHPIVDYSRLASFGVRTAILMNPNYRAENERLLRESGISVTLTELIDMDYATRD